MNLRRIRGIVTMKSSKEANYARGSFSTFEWHSVPSGVQKQAETKMTRLPKILGYTR